MKRAVVRLVAYLALLTDRSADAKYVAKQCGGRWKLSRDIADMMMGKGCLYGKTEEQVDDFFTSLRAFYDYDREFFQEQFEDLLPVEKMMFREFLKSESTDQRREDYISDHFSIENLLVEIAEMKSNSSRQ